MGILIWLLFADLAFLAGLWLLYLFVTRRQAKILLLVDHLAALAARSMPIPTGLRMIGSDIGGLFGGRLTRAARRVEDGASLGQAFEEFPGTFPILLRRMIGLGEKSGNLAGFLAGLRDSYGRIAQGPTASLFYFFYPVAISVTVNLSLTVILTFIMPKWYDVLMSVGSSQALGVAAWAPGLSAANQGVLGLCILIFILVLLGGPSIHFGITPLRRLQGLLDAILRRLPWLGRILRDGALNSFCAATGMFLKAGAALPEAVGAVASAETNPAVRKRLDLLASRVRDGEPLSKAARSDPYYPPEFLWLVETGEASGKLGDHLLRAAGHYDTKVRFGAQMAVRSLVPLFVVLNGALVLCTCLLIFLPMTELMKAVSR